jgi:hypothetical protein
MQESFRRTDFSCRWTGTGALSASFGIWPAVAGISHGEKPWPEKQNAPAEAGAFRQVGKKPV